MGMGLATTFVMTLASICARLIDTRILIPLDLVYLRTLAFITVIAVVVQFTGWSCVKPARRCIACWGFSCR